MKAIKRILVAVMCSAAAFSVFAESITLNWGSEDSRQNFEFNTEGVNVGGTTIKVPAEVVKIIKENQGKIEQALTQKGITSSAVSNAMGKVEEAYKKLSTEYGFKTDAPITTVENGLNTFCDDLCDSLPNSQTTQNVWAEAWIGKIFPFPHLGFGINAGASKLDIVSLKDAAEALSIDVDDLRDSYAFPTVTADVRLGGLILPFDIGFTACSIDTSKLGSLEDALDPVSFDFFAIGGDIRYALLQGGGIRPKLSIGGGFYYTDGSVKVTDDTATAALDFNSTTIFASTQASVKLLCLVPYIGGRVLFSKTKVDWSVDADWSKIYTGQRDEITNVMNWGILPTHFEGSGESDYFEDIRPQVFGGLGIDLFIINVTANFSYDFLSKIPAAGMSVRLAL